jgi:N-acetylglutamate synthase-like GNAT family acetyltransferase
VFFLAFTKACPTIVHLSSSNNMSGEGNVRKSISIRMIRHAESRNNQVYRDARFLFRGGTPDFDEKGWTHYVNKYRCSDPSLSDTGSIQRDRLADYLVPHLLNQSSLPVRIICSPMRRTLETIRPTLERLQGVPGNSPKSHIIVNALYHESEGCHTHEKAEEGMNPNQIREVLKDSIQSDDDIQFEGFPKPDRGWYVNGKGAETRMESETRASTFYLWLCEYLDRQLDSSHPDVFDAGVSIPEESDENEHDKFQPRYRKRRTTILVGHADFMSLILKRIVTGFGHFIESEGIPHRSAFVHCNTGITELEYFGNGRFLLMASNQTPHFSLEEYSTLRGGGSLKDGWSYIVPSDEVLLNSEVSIAYADEEIDDYVKEQTHALKTLYLPSAVTNSSHKQLNVEKQDQEENGDITFFVKRGLQVVGCATYSEKSGTISEVVLRQSARKEKDGCCLIDAIRSHARKLGRSRSLFINSSTLDNKDFLEDLGFLDVDEVDGKHLKLDI